MFFLSFSLIARVKNNENVEFYEKFKEKIDEKLPFSRHWIQNTVICVVPGTERE